MLGIVILRKQRKRFPIFKKEENDLRKQLKDGKKLCDYEKWDK